jgi:hypothetical protein
MLQEGFTVVITPLLALCEDQMAYMSACNVPVVRIDSSIERVEQVAVCTRIQSASTDLKAVYTTPETLRHNKLLGSALRVASAEGRVNFATIDEAHCILEWSEFRCVVCTHLYIIVNAGSTLESMFARSVYYLIIARGCVRSMFVTGQSTQSLEKHENGLWAKYRFLH